MAFFLMVNSLWGQPSIRDVLESGNIKALDYHINYHYNDGEDSTSTERIMWDMEYGLCTFNKNELRIIRNMVYAKYGYIFNSKDLREYFSKYKWYSGIKTNVDSEINKDERSFINLIQKIENNYPKEDNSELIGLWVEFEDGDQWIPFVIKRYGMRRELRFYSNGTFYYAFPVTELDYYSYYGLWSLKNNKFSVELLFAWNNSYIYDLNNFNEKLLFYNLEYSPYINENLWECKFFKNRQAMKKIDPDPHYLYYK